MSSNSPNGSNVNVHVTQRHPRYYIEGADLHVVVGKTLFRVYSFFFTRESNMFHRDVHPVTPGTPRKGLSEGDPILLENISPEDFETFLWVFYNPLYSIYEATVEKWKVILKLADLWEFKEVKELAVRELHKKPELDLVDRLALYQNYKVDARHMVPLYGLLCARDKPLVNQEAKILGLDTTILIATMREQLRSSPTNERGKSPLPQGIEMSDVFKALEKEMDLEEGATSKLYQDNGLVLPTDTTGSGQSFPNGRPHGGGGSSRGGTGKPLRK